jgi:hypothetical protein
VGVGDQGLDHGVVIELADQVPPTASTERNEEEEEEEEEVVDSEPVNPSEIEADCLVDMCQS